MMLDQFQALRMALNGLGYVNIVTDDVGLFGTLLAIFWGGLLSRMVGTPLAVMSWWLATVGTASEHVPGVPLVTVTTNFGQFWTMIE